MNLLLLPALAYRCCAPALAGILVTAGLLSGCASIATPPNASVSAPVAVNAAPGFTESVTPGDATKLATNSPNLPSYPSGELTPINAGNTASPTVASQTAPTDLWERIRRGFAMPDLDTDLVREREHWYVQRPDYIGRMIGRSNKYLFHIVEELERRNMPTELALLPFIESAFNPQAVSSAKAAGMWQFMPATGKHFALKQNAFRDDRRDVLASTRAALDYLQKLHRMFGNWHLALAAYNWGEGSVMRAIAKNQRAGLGVGYLDLNMPNETRHYVPKLQAVKNIVARPQSLNVGLPHISNHPYFDSVTITRDIDVALAAKLAEVGLDDFKALNPSQHRPVILAAGTPQILLPWDNAAIFTRNLSARGDAGLASWTVWLAPTNMKPADAAKRVGMSEASLRSVNLIPPRTTIRAGSSLLVPRAAHVAQDVTERVADTGQLNLAPDAVQRRTVLKAGKRDNVASIAKRYQVSAQSVADWNKVSTSATFKPGQQVVVFVTVQPRSASRHAKSAPARSSSGTVAKQGKAQKPAAVRVAKR